MAEKFDMNHSYEVVQKMESWKIKLKKIEIWKLKYENTLGENVGKEWR
jgi:hypothetical protein